MSSGINLGYDQLRNAFAPEVDPLGLKLNVPGAKADAGKVRMSLMTRGFARALYEVAKIATFGAEKYTPDGWMHVPDGYNRYADAQQRHQNAHDRGEIYGVDEVNGRKVELMHLAQEAWNSLAKLELFLLEQKSRELSPEKTPRV